MARKTALALSAGVAATVMATAFAVAAGGTASGAGALGETPEEEARMLGCGRAPLMVIHADLYIPSRAGDPARTPEEALDRLLADHYPRAPRALFQTAGSDGGRTKFHVRSATGALLASFLTGSHRGEHYVEQIALCEPTAKGWGR